MARLPQCGDFPQGGNRGPGSAAAPT